MDDDIDPGSLKNIRNFDFGSADDDLEAIQNEFLRSNAKPAATVIRRSKAPAIASTSEKQQAKSVDASNKDDACALPDEKPVTSSCIMDFARRMNEAVKEFEVRENKANADGPPVLGLSSSQAPPKKLSLFAQRRLAKQTLGSEPNIGYGKSSDLKPAATFLPKLMAPVPEHTLTEPVAAPGLQPRESGFPEIPVDFDRKKAEYQETKDAQGISETHTQTVQTANSKRSSDAWSEMRKHVSVENTTRINSMSQAEILEAQEEVKSMLSSDTIQRLLRRKQVLTKGALGEAAGAPAEAREGEQAAADTKDSRASKQVRFADKQDADEVSKSDPGSDCEYELSAPPPPPAEWVNQDGQVDKSESGSDDKTAAAAAIDIDNNDTGVDSEFYSEMKRKFFPSEVVEEAKLAWILGHGQAKSPMEQAVRRSRESDAKEAAAKIGVGRGTDESGDIDEHDLLSKPVSLIRFAFDGQIMTEEQMDIPTMAGLHHHGENPDKPGYTIPELLHLSRSTVPAQRSVATSTLACILHKINVGGWDVSQAVEIYVGLLDWQAELYFAQGIADSNKTCRAESTVALWTWIVEMSKYKSLVRLATGGDMEEAQGQSLPGPEIEMLPKPIVAKGELVSRTFKAFDAILTVSFMENAYQIISRSTMAEQQLTLLAECIKCLGGMSEEFDQRIREHSKLIVLLQNRYPFLMSK
ncbi:hypothetical protein LPJ56_002365 [Coemansia sp. RSA 2599]|nr:hypothetical protein LPJ56_002365 [Coemansia sp. RSA 2599]